MGNLARVERRAGLFLKPKSRVSDITPGTVGLVCAQGTRRLL